MNKTFEINVCFTICSQSRLKQNLMFPSPGPPARPEPLVLLDRWKSAGGRGLLNHTHVALSQGFKGFGDTL